MRSKIREKKGINLRRKRNLVSNYLLIIFLTSQFPLSFFPQVSELESLRRKRNIVSNYLLTIFLLLLKLEKLEKKQKCGT
jgi:hypothetical protein